MSEMTAIFVDTSDAALAALKEAGVDTGDVQDVMDIPATAFQLVLQSRANSDLFGVRVSEGAGENTTVCAVRLSGEPGAPEELEQDGDAATLIYFGSRIPWEELQRVADESDRYTALMHDLETLENKCMSADERNSVRRQQFQQEYEYLQEEIDKVEHTLRNTPLTG